MPGQESWLIKSMNLEYKGQLKHFGGDTNVHAIFKINPGILLVNKN